MIRVLLGPFDYLRIRHDSKFKVDWLIPLLLTFFSMSLMVFAVNKSLNIFYPSGLVDRILGFTQILPGFYIAALAAIATFQKNDIDQAMPSPAPVITMQIKGKSVVATLSRRRFLCSMFTFLTAESILIIGVCIVGLNFVEIIKSVFPIDFHKSIKIIYLFSLLFLLWQLIVSTFWGLYYLGDRLHRD